MKNLKRSENKDAICDALVGIAYYDPDWRWVQSYCLLFLNHRDADIRGLAATCLGHLARIHRVIDLNIVLPELKKLLKDPEIGGRVEDALSDIEIFLKNN